MLPQDKMNWRVLKMYAWKFCSCYCNNWTKIALELKNGNCAMLAVLVGQQSLIESVWFLVERTLMIFKNLTKKVIIICRWLELRVALLRYSVDVQPNKNICLFEKFFLNIKVEIKRKYVATWSQSGVRASMVFTFAQQILEAFKWALRSILISFDYFW